MAQSISLRSVIFSVALIGTLFIAFPSTSADEGQWPLSMVHKLDLVKAGIKVPASEIFNDKKPSLVDAICRVGGATGSFVSDTGLILTNHHVAFDAVSKASTPEQDYLHDGFVANTLADEVIAQGYTARITVGYRDVSKEVLSVITPEMSPVERSRAVAAKRRTIVTQAKKDTPSLDAEVAEMFQGRNYVLFQYELLKDVRMVVVPPRSVGEYGGETDNWIWPRHTGDFAFLRAYVGPDGNPAPYSKENIPFRPKRFLKINAKGVSSGDAVFLLGYPGSTFRHQSAAFVAHDQFIKMPFVADLYEERIRLMENLSANDRGLRLKLGPQIKGLANTMKNYRGKLLGLSRLNLVAKKKAEEQELMKWIEATEERRKNYGQVLARVNEIYAQMRLDTRLNYARYRLNSAHLWQTATLAHDAQEFLNTKQEDRPKNFQNASITRTLERAIAGEKAAMPGMNVLEVAGGVKMALDLEAESGIEALSAWRKELVASHGTDDHQKLAEKVADLTRLSSPEFRTSLFDPTNTDRNDDLYALIGILKEPFTEGRKRGQAFRGELDALMALYVDAKSQWKAEDFCPDANFTLRMTFGRIRSYEPQDGVTYHPLTTLSGMVAKATGKEPFDAPKELIDLWRKKDFGNYMDKDLNDVPVGILYDCDTTGGNSGSPVMNSVGEVIGLNFDRAYEATINDYQWSSDYSRSIGVDIRYVLWITEKLMGSTRVIKEVTGK
ncbi:MAG: hypothetical protein ACI97A_000383 [Planctomycetota bacterium]|jgi:hypothetical protein